VGRVVPPPSPLHQTSSPWQGEEGKCFKQGSPPLAKGEVGRGKNNLELSLLSC